jgi:Flp pilus assembly protein TadG
MMRRNGERGSAMIEAAFILSLLLAITAGLAETGRRMLAYHFVSHAAREATRFAEVRGATSRQPATPAAIEAYVKRIAIGVDPGEIRVETRWTPDNSPGGTVRVKVAVGGLQSTSEVVVLH